MRRSMIISISMISIAIMMMTSACAPRKDEFETGFRARLVRHYAEDDKAARAMNGEALRIDITFIDLDGDGRPEAIVRLDHPAFCGSHGCAIDVMRFQESRIVVLGAFIAYETALHYDATTQRHNVVIDARAWIMFDDGLVLIEP